MWLHLSLKMNLEPFWSVAVCFISHSHVVCFVSLSVRLARRWSILSFQRIYFDFTSYLYFILIFKINQLQLYLFLKVLATYLLFKKDFIYFLLERGEGREKEREKNINVWLPLIPRPPTGAPAHNSGMCPDWELNRRLFALQASTQSTELHQPGCQLLFLYNSFPNFLLVYNFFLFP